MIIIIAALGVGIVFGAGLALAGMLNPSKVVGFLPTAFPALLLSTHEAPRA